MVTALTGRDAVVGLVFATFCFWFYMIKGKGFVVDRWVVAICTAIVPGIFNRLTPHVLSFFSCHCFKIVKVVMGLL